MVLVDCCALTSEPVELVLDWLVALVSGVVAALLLGVLDVELVALVSGVVLLDGVVDWLLALVSGVVELPVDEVVEDCELMSVLLVLGVVAAVLPGVLVALVSGVVLLDGVVDWLLALVSGVVELLVDEVVADCELMSVLLVLGAAAALADWSGAVLVDDCVEAEVDGLPAGTECSWPGSVGVSERGLGSVLVTPALGAPDVS